MLPPKVRWALLLSLLGISGALAYWGDRGSNGASSVVAATPIDRAARKSENVRSLPNPAPADEILAIEPRRSPPVPQDAFAVRDWTPPPPELPKEKEVAPPLPFSYLGKQQQEGDWVVFLGRRDTTYVVREKDVLEGLYLVEKIVPPSLVLVYLPLQEKQFLSIGEP